jgi:predicted ester cyclase
MKGASMQSTVVQAAPETVRAFLDEYFDAWKGTDEGRILAYYADQVVIQLPTGTLEGKVAVRDKFVRPFIGGFPGNVHAIRNLAHAMNLVAVEWNFEAVHLGAFANIQPTSKKVQIPGCSFYQYDLSVRQITAGRIYFDLGTLLRQIGAEG